MRFVRSGALALGLAGTLLLGSVAARAEHSDVDFPGIGTVTLRTIKAVGALPSVALAGPDGKVLLNATVGGTQSDYFRISKSADGTLNPTVHYAVLNGPDVTSKAVLAVAIDAGVSLYDAGYLWLARSLDLPLATLDEQLIQAAPHAGVKLFDISTL